jgi:beta-phosphoglucomutase-like phosphatase (HAD superfamily)
MIRYVFWDSDNTLFENETFHWLKHKETLASHGITLDEAFRARIYHNNGRQNWEWLSAELGLSVPCEQYLDEIDRWYGAHAGDIPLRPGVAEALSLFEKLGAYQCVVSNGRRSSVTLPIAAQDLAPRFAFILCKEDYEGRKPDPVPYLSALKRMEEIAGHPIDKKECLAIEDDPLGATAASRAGIAVLHRRLRENDPIAPEAIASVYAEEDFLNRINSALLSPRRGERSEGL